MPSPYVTPTLPGPYASLDAEAQTSQGRTSSSQSSSAAVSGLLHRGTDYVTHGAAHSLQSALRSGLSHATSSAATQAAAASSAQMTTGLQVAVAQVQFLANVAAATNAAVAPVVSAVTAAMTVVGPFAVLAVLGALGLDTTAAIEAASHGLTSGQADAIAQSIRDLLARGAAEDQILSHPETTAHALKEYAEPTLPLLDHQTIHEASHIVGHLSADGTLGDTIAFRIETPSIYFVIDGDALVYVPHGRVAVDQPIIETLVIDAIDLQTGAVTRNTITVRVDYTNEAPTAIAIDGGTTFETAETGSVVGSLSVLDPNPRDGISFSLTTNSDLFAIRGDAVILKSSAHDAQGQSFALGIRATDTGGLSFDGTVTVSVLDAGPIAVAVTSAFDGHTLTIMTSGTDPAGEPMTLLRDGVPLLSHVITYTVAELAAGATPWSLSAVNRDGQRALPIDVIPPKLAAAAAHDHPVPPTILGSDLAVLPEGQQATVHVTAYDAIDGVITVSVGISPQPTDYEAHTLNIPVSVTNSQGLTATETIHILITEVDTPPTISIQDHGPAAISGGVRIRSGDGFASEVTITTPNGQAHSFSILDSAGLPISIVAANPLNHGDPGTFVYMASGNHASLGLHIIDVRVTDSHGLSADAHFDIFVS